MAYLGEYTNAVNFAADSDKLDGKDSTYFEVANPNIQTHIGSTSNPHGVTAAQAGADPSGTASTLMANHIGAVDPHTQYVKEADLVSLLPSYVDDVLEFANLAAFPAEGESGKVYVAADTNVTYRWSGSAYVVIGSDLALGETSSTAYRGDRGKVAYDHSQAAHAPSDAEKNVQSDWTQADSGADDFIKNKPTIPAAQVSSDWSSASGVSQILNKPTLGEMAFQADVANDGKQYVRKDKAWSEVVIPEGGIVAEAKSSSFTAVKNRRYVVSTAGGAVTATLPASPVVGDYIEFVDAGSTWTATDFTISRNGLKINGDTSDFVCDTDNVQVSLTYTGASYGWAVKVGASVLVAAPHTIGSHSDVSGGTTGTGQAVLNNTPTLVTPALGAATATSLAIGGATLSDSALAVTGSVEASGTLRSTSQLGAVFTYSGGAYIAIQRAGDSKGFIGTGNNITAGGNNDDFGIDASDGNLILAAGSVQRASISSTGLSVTGQYNITTLNTAPSSASDTGTTGEIRYTADHIYVCVATNTWKRSALSTW